MDYGYRHRGRVDLKPSLETTRTNIWILEKRDGIEIEKLRKRHCPAKPLLVLNL